MKKEYRLKISDCRFIVIVLVIFAAAFFPFSSAFSQTVKIGAALPLFEDSDDPGEQQLGNEILDGISFALNEYNRSPRVKVKLITKGYPERPPDMCRYCSTAI